MGFVTDFISDITGASAAGDAAAQAGQLQYDAAMQGINAQQAQFDKLVELLSPYISAGQQGIEGLQGLMGLQGQEAQQQAVSAIENSPEFMNIVQQGENAMLQNASATGGLRGGNMQAALSQFRPAALSSLINQQYGRYGNLLGAGQNAAFNQAGAGMNMGNNIANLLNNAGAAQAGGIIGQGNAGMQGFNNLLGIGGLLGGLLS